MDPMTFASTVAILMAAALAGCYVPARRATQVDPLVALKTD
jgi:ABC-type antimicrobial peptide transport system permease subunit